MIGIAGRTTRKCWKKTISPARTIIDEGKGSPRYLNPKCKRKSWDTTETHFSVATNQEHMNSLPGWLQNYLGPSKHCGSIRPRVSQLVPCWFPVPCVNTFLFWPHVSIVCYIWHTGSQLTHAAHVFEFWFSSWPWFRLRCYRHPLWEHNGWKARCFSRNWYTLKRRSRRVLLNAVSNSSHIPTNTERLVAMYSRWRMSSFFRSLIPRESEFFFLSIEKPTIFFWQADQASQGEQTAPTKISEAEYRTRCFLKNKKKPLSEARSEMNLQESRVESADKVLRKSRPQVCADVKTVPQPFGLSGPMARGHLITK